MKDKTDTKLNLNRSVLLDQETDDMLQKLVNAKHYRSTSIVMREAIRQMYQEEIDNPEAKLEAITTINNKLKADIAAKRATTATHKAQKKVEADLGLSRHKKTKDA